MARAASVLPERRSYGQWVAAQTRDDPALRYTPEDARQWSATTVLQTALGGTAFLACEAAGASITLLHGVPVAIAAIATACLLMFVTGLPIAIHAARSGLRLSRLHDHISDLCRFHLPVLCSGGGYHGRGGARGDRIAAAARLYRLRAGGDPGGAIWPERDFTLSGVDTACMDRAAIAAGGIPAGAGRRCA
ncbi:MAG TPA: hypothetical protein PLM58_15770 [Novosphingobium sp.]|nr:hypothetical protein [Novosphingobium sp.]